MNDMTREDMTPRGTSERRVPPLVKEVAVPVGLERAFELFTAHLADWWPLATHSVGEADAAGVALEGHLGGEIVETLADGTTSVWGTVLEWEPPHRVAFTWHPGGDPEESGTVSVSFHETSTGTRVELVHSGWERRPDAARARDSYDSGWEFVLGRYVDHVTVVAG